MNWINILHLYQPPTQELEILKLATEQSYIPLINFIKRNPRVMLTLNISGCLTELLVNNGYGKIIEDIKKLAQKNQIEFTASAAYHAFLPLLDENEIIYQIKENERINKKYFGREYKTTGFFLPELAYNKKLLKILETLKYKWIVLDEISCGNFCKKNDFTKIYKIKNSKVNVIFRNRQISNTYVPETLFNLLKKQNNTNIITTTDGELYGHHHKDNQNYLQKIIDSKKINFLKTSEYINLAKEKAKEIEPINSTWESTAKHIQKKCPYHLWRHNKNKIHQRLWKLSDLSVKLVHKNSKHKDYQWARYHLNRGLASCTYWWASEQDLSEKFGPITWNPDVVDKGVNELIRSIRSLSSIDKKTKIKAEKLYLKIKKMVWTRHWKIYA